MFRRISAVLSVVSCAHHRRVIRPIRPQVVASLLTATIVAAALLPPTHIHLLAEHDHDHGGVVEHAHWAAHHQTGSQVGDDDGRVLFIDRPAVPAAANQRIDRPATAVIAVLIAARPRTFTLAQRASDNAPRDGPPRGLSLLRAPPLPLAL